MNVEMEMDKFNGDSFCSCSRELRLALKISLLSPFLGISVILLTF